MRFRVEYASGAAHEVDLPGSVATVGRDPSSDLVLNDPKCSRRHAVIETGADGITIRDSGSANGVFVNGKKTERSRLRAGDVIKLGDVAVTVLPEALSGTVVAEDFEGLAARRLLDAEVTAPDIPESVLPAAAARRPLTGSFRSADEVHPVEPLEGPGTFSGGRRPRPLTVTVLVALWALSVALYFVAPTALAFATPGAGRAALLVAGVALAALSGVMAFGLWQGRRWAWVLQVAVAAIGIFICPFTLASIAVLIYMLRPAVQWHFSDRQRPRPESAGQGEAMFAGALVAAVVLGVLLTAALTVLARTARTVAGARGGRMFVRTPAPERIASEQLKVLAAAEDAFHSVCNTGYGDLQGLLRPGTVIADYPPDGPAFLRGPDFERAERDGYRYTLTVEDEMPPTAGCPTRRFRRFLYTATPLGAGRSLAVGPDGVLHAAEGRPAHLDDPPAE